MSIRLFIADTDGDHIHRIERCVSSCRDIRVVGTHANGAHALELLAATPADILISEIQLPGMDGLTLLRELRSLQNPPAAIMCTQFYSSECVSKACALGAAFYMYKPLKYAALPGIIRECCRARLRGADDAGLDGSAPKLRSTSEIIQALLTEIGMPANLTGRMYLYEALSMVLDDPSLTRNLSKGLYAKVAARTGTTPERMERAVRNAIAIAYDRGDLRRRFSHRPTNREFLMYLPEQLRLRMYV